MLKQLYGGIGVNPMEAVPRFKEIVENADCLADGVSAWSVGKHIEHCCLAMTGMSNALESSSPPMPARGFSLLRFIVLTTCSIPRGRGKAPEEVLPNGENLAAVLPKMLEESEAAVRAAEGLDKRTWFRHPVFGVLDRDQTLKLIAIHNKHHLAIIEDVLKASN